jgi:RecB family exonuclease
VSVRDLWDRAWRYELARGTKDGAIALIDIRQSSRTTKANPDGENVEWWYENGFKFVESWIEWRENSKWKIWTLPDGQPAIEVVLDIEFGGIPFKGAIDRVFETEDGELVILDLKTGSRTPSTDFQLEVYACMLERAYGIRPKWGCYWMARTGQTSLSVDLSKFTLKKLDTVVAQFQKAREHNIYLPNFDGCKMCSLKEYCDYKSGEKALPLGELEHVK